MGRIIDRIVILVEDVRGRLARPGDAELRSSLRRAVSRASELLVENAELQDRIDELERLNQEQEDMLGHLRSNGPALYRDEVEAIRAVILRDIVDFESIGDPDRARRIEALRLLLDRCDPVPVTPGPTVTAPREHGDPPPGYGPCTRPWPHNGPCAHPLCEGCITVAFEIAAGAGQRSPGAQTFCTRCIRRTEEETNERA